MYKFTCIIVDDEYLAINILIKFLQGTEQVNCIGEFKNPVEALSFLQTTNVDIAFIDIQMPGINGIELLQKLIQKPLVIFTTASADYALQAYNLDVVDYLLKPISQERFSKALQKAIDYAAYKKSELETENQYLFVKAEYKIIQINIKEIIYIESLSEYVKIHTTQTKILTLGALKELIKQLPANDFIRIHKSFIIHKKFIKAYNLSSVQLLDNIILPIGRHFKTAYAKSMSL